MRKFHIISLGCMKNRVDSEALFHLLLKANFEATNELENADLVCINTCGFINDAKIENINKILEVVDFKNKVNKDLKIMVIGCLVERYLDELKKSIPEVDLWIKYKEEYKEIPVKLGYLFKDSSIFSDMDLFKREVDNDEKVLYLKISEGCNRYCAFCAIPYIRGNLISYDEDKLVEFAKNEFKTGKYVELDLIGQDPTSYGKDLKDQNIDLLHLIKRLYEIPEVKKIRLLYLYPSGINDELIEFIATHEKMCKYFDIPIQHVSDKVLKLMNRRDNKESTTSLLYKIRKRIPDAIFRTTVLVGFPGETNKEFKELVEFIKEFRFNHLGVFSYSKEEGTLGYKLEHQVSEKVKSKRHDEIMELQKTISYEKNLEFIGKKLTGYIYKDGSRAKIRTDLNAPDDIDGNIYMLNNTNKNGDIVEIEIDKAYVYDLVGHKI